MNRRVRPYRVRNILLVLVCFYVQAICIAQNQLVVRGIVTDTSTKLPINCATVSAIGVQAKAADCTDNNGQFDLILNSQIKRGDQIRVRVQKEGYVPADFKIAASPDIVNQIKLSPLQRRVSLTLPDVVQVLRGTAQDGATEFEINLHQARELHFDIVRLVVDANYSASNVCAALADKISIYTFNDTLTVNRKSAVRGSVPGEITGTATSERSKDYAYTMTGHISTRVCPSIIGHLSLTVDVAIPIHDKDATIALRFPPKFHIVEGVSKNVYYRRDPQEPVSDTDTFAIPSNEFEEISLSSFTDVTFTLTAGHPHEGNIVARYPFH